MEAAFDRVGPHGRAMMCSTAAIQVCVDAGGTEQVSQRWAALHEICPTLLATFANSPMLAGRRTGWASSRMAAWFALDPVRTRPQPVRSEPAADWAHRALDTPLLCRRRPGSCWEVPAGITFADWLDGALPGCPGPDDLDYHLTTLFPPVRPHGYFEVRYLDTQPLGQWSLPVAVLAALLADPATIDAARERCAPTTQRWGQAARYGLTDPALAHAAVGLFELACAALPALDPPPWLQALLEDVTERRVRRGRCPADDNPARTPTTGGIRP
jgi:glutamate--cysteine ligase